MLPQSVQSMSLCISCSKHDWEYHLNRFRDSRVKKDGKLYIALKDLCYWSGYQNKFHDKYEDAKAEVKSTIRALFPDLDYMACCASSNSPLFVIGLSAPFFQISNATQGAIFYLGDDRTMIILPSLNEIKLDPRFCTFCGRLPELLQYQWKINDLDTEQLSEIPLYCVFQSTTKLESHTMTVYPKGLTHFVATVDLRPTVGLELLPRQIVDKQVIEPGLLKSWYRECCQKHSRCWSMDVSNTSKRKKRTRSLLKLVRDQYESKETTLTRLRVVDVHLNKVVNVTDSSRYIALSYVWGTSSVYRATRGAFKCKLGDKVDSKSSYLSLDGVTLPRTIEDAMQVVREVGERYLWVDSLCINQDDPIELNRILKKMHLIYRNAVLTIFAASGRDANAGMPRVRPGYAKNPEPIVQIDGRCFVTTLKMPPMKLNPWSDRAWTFQEAFFSGKFLLFQEDRAYYFCKEASYCEEYQLHANPYGLHNSWRYIGVGLNGVQKLGEDELEIELQKPFMLPVYFNCVRHYTARKITKQEDILNGFSAILGQAETIYAIRSYWGLLTYVFDSSLSWVPVFSEACRGSTRRPGFPTWSWAGYLGPVAYPLEHSEKWYQGPKRYKSRIQWPWDLDPDIRIDGGPFATGVLQVNAPVVELEPPIAKPPIAKGYENKGSVLLDNGTPWTTGRRDVVVLGGDTYFDKENNITRWIGPYLGIAVTAGPDNIYRRDGFLIIDVKDAMTICDGAEMKKIYLG